MFNGFGNIDLSNLKDDRQTMLDVGKHEVVIKDAKVEANADKGTHQLVLNYENSDGAIRQWIYLNHPTSEKATEIGLLQVKKLLLAIGHDGESTPDDVAYLRGKKVGINIVNDEYNGNVRKKVNYHFKLEEKAEGAKIDDEIPF